MKGVALKNQSCRFSCWRSLNRFFSDGQRAESGYADLRREETIPRERNSSVVPGGKLFHSKGDGGTNK